MRNELESMDMTSVMVFETHPAVQAGLVRRLEAEEGVRVIGRFSEPEALSAAVASLNPDVVVVGMFGPAGTRAVNLATNNSAGTRVVVLVPSTLLDHPVGLPRQATVVRDGPRGDRVAALVSGCGKAVA